MYQLGSIKERTMMSNFQEQLISPRFCVVLWVIKIKQLQYVPLRSRSGRTVTAVDWNDSCVNVVLRLSCESPANSFSFLLIPSNRGSLMAYSAWLLKFRLLVAYHRKISLHWVTSLNTMDFVIDFTAGYRITSLNIERWYKCEMECVIIQPRIADMDDMQQSQWIGGLF